MAQHTLGFAVVLALGTAGYGQAPAWLVPAGAACLTVAAWRPWRLERQVRSAWTSKTTTYLVTGIVADLGVAGLAFGAGRMLRALLG